MDLDFVFDLCRKTIQLGDLSPSPQCEAHHKSFGASGISRPMKKSAAANNMTAANEHLNRISYYPLTPPAVTPST